jgi:hypothetical protein
MTDNNGQTFIIHYRNVEQDEQNYEDENQPDIQSSQNKPSDLPKETSPPVSHDSIKDEVHKDMINSFLNGDQCLNGVNILNL